MVPGADICRSCMACGRTDVVRRGVLNTETSQHQSLLRRRCWSHVQLLFRVAAVSCVNEQPLYITLRLNAGSTASACCVPLTTSMALNDDDDDDNDNDKIAGTAAKS